MTLEEFEEGFKRDTDPGKEVDCFEAIADTIDDCLEAINEAASARKLSYTVDRKTIFGIAIDVSVMAVPEDKENEHLVLFVGDVYSHHMKRRAALAEERRNLN